MLKMIGRNTNNVQHCQAYITVHLRVNQILPKIIPSCLAIKVCSVYLSLFCVSLHNDPVLNQAKTAALFGLWFFIFSITGSDCKQLMSERPRRWKVSRAIVLQSTFFVSYFMLGNYSAIPFTYSSYYFCQKLSRRFYTDLQRFYRLIVLFWRSFLAASLPI